MTADECSERHRARELDVEIPRIAQDHDEGVELDGGPVGLRETTDLGPVALGLLARRRLEAHGQPRIDVILGSERLKKPAHDLERAGKALSLDLRVQANGR